MATPPNKNAAQDVKLDSHDPEKVKARLLAKYPPKVARKRAKQIVVNRVDPDGKTPAISSNVRTRTRPDGPAGVLLCRMQGRGFRPDEGHHQHHPRPHRLRLLQLADPPQPDRSGQHCRRPQFHDLLLFHGYAGPGNHIRGREEAQAGHSGGLR